MFDRCWLHVLTMVHHFWCLLHYLGFVFSSIGFALFLDRCLMKYLNVHLVIISFSQGHCAKNKDSQFPKLLWCLNGFPSIFDKMIHQFLTMLGLILDIDFGIDFTPPLRHLRGSKCRVVRITKSFQEALLSMFGNPFLDTDFQWIMDGVGLHFG